MVKSFLQTAFVVIVGLSILGIAGRYASQHVAPGTTGDHAKLIKEAQDNAYQWGDEQLEFQKQAYEAKIAELEERLEKCGCH